MSNTELASVKKINDKPEFVSDEEYRRRILEIAKCKRDIVYFAENYFRIISNDPKPGIYIIKLYEKQKEMLRAFANNRRTICLSARQTGKTTTYTIFCLWLCTFFSEQRVMICANKLQTAIEVMDRLRLAYEYLPYWIKCPIITYNKTEISFANKSTMRCFATSSSASRGFSATCLIIDEAAFIPKNIMDQFFASVMPIISSSKESKAIIVSTPNGTGNIFYEIWQQANAKDIVKNKEGWKPIEVYWFEVPGRDEEWKEQQIATFGKEKFAQEFNNEFLAGSSYSKLIPEDIIEKYRIQLQQWKNDNINQPKSLQIISKNGDKVYEFKVWHEFDASHTYIAAGDVSEGAGQDSSVLYIFDITDVRSIKMCAKFSNNVVQPTEFAFITNKILSLYANPYFICESNGVGSSFIDILRDTFEYQNIVKEGKDGNYGIRSHIQSKIKACIWAKEILTTNGVNFELYDIDLIDEMTTFIKKNSNSTVHDFYKAMYGAHDDHIMTLIWAAWMLNPDIVNKYFIVVESFETEFGKILPLIIQPMFAYTYTDIKSVTNDPLYQQFKLLKDEAIAEYNNITKKEQNIINKKNTQNADQYVRLQNEMYSKNFVIIGNDIGMNSYDFSDF